MIPQLLLFISGSPCLFWDTINHLFKSAAPSSFPARNMRNSLSCSQNRKWLTRNLQGMPSSRRNPMTVTRRIIKQPYRCLPWYDLLTLLIHCRINDQRCSDSILQEHPNHPNTTITSTLFAPFRNFISRNLVRHYTASHLPASPFHLRSLFDCRPTKDASDLPSINRLFKLLQLFLGLFLRSGGRLSHGRLLVRLCRFSPCIKLRC